MKIAAFMIVRDEETFIEYNIKYHLDLGFDYIFILDHCSTDNTSKILKRFLSNKKIILLEEGDTCFDHERIANKVLQYAIKYFKSDWFIPLDADEFLGIKTDIHSFISDLERNDIFYATIGWANALIHSNLKSQLPIETNLFYFPRPERYWQHEGHFRKAIVKYHDGIQVVSGGHYFKVENNPFFYEQTKGSPYMIPSTKAKLYHFECRDNPKNLLKKWKKNAEFENETSLRKNGPWFERIEQIKKYAETYENDLYGIEKLWFTNEHTFWGSEISETQKISDNHLRNWIRSKKPKTYE